MTLATVPQYDRGRVAPGGEHAVVVGAGMAGLLAARVLADGFDRVTVVERDPLPDEPVARDGVPQARHVHVLLEAGRAVLEALFPGYRRDLLDAGGLEIDGARDVHFFVEGDFLADGPQALPHYAATRPLYEWLVRRRLAALDGVDLRTDCSFTDYRPDDAGTTVDGVLVRDGGASVAELDASLVVDATGRTSRTPAWLERHGYVRPPTEEVHVDLAYSTILIRRPSDDHRAYVVTPSPSRPRGASVLPVEDDRWLVTLGGLHGDHPPTEMDAFVPFASTLPVPQVRELLETYEPTVDGVAHYPFPSSLRRRYETLEGFPAGLLVVGDAIASFNPLYAQGMSVAALEALTLHHALATGGLDGLAQRFFAASEAVVDAAWTMAVGSDFQFPETTGPRPRGTALVNRYVARLNRRAQSDGSLREAFFRVMMMERPPASLFRPGVVWRVLKPVG